MCLLVCLLGGTPIVRCMFTLCRSSGSIATDLQSLLADCLGATDTHHHHANNSDREGTGIYTSTCSYFYTVNSYSYAGVEMSKQKGNGLQTVLAHYYMLVSFIQDHCNYKT